MADPRTQDIQKVFNSTTANFQSFMNGVENVSSSRNMEVIYSNMTKLFDEFAQGQLMLQGANSEHLLRTIYRALDENTIKLLQNQDAVDKIAQKIREKSNIPTQDNKQTSNQVSPEVPIKEDNTQQVPKEEIKQTLEIKTVEEGDIGNLMIDFLSELQESILRIQIDLNREYDKKKLELQRRRDDQKQDIDLLQSELQDQSTSIASYLEHEKDENEKTILKFQSELDQIDKMISLFGKKQDTITQAFGVEGESTSRDINKILFSIEEQLKKMSSIKNKDSLLQQVNKTIESNTTILEKEIDNVIVKEQHVKEINTTIKEVQQTKEVDTEPKAKQDSVPPKDTTRKPSVVPQSKPIVQQPIGKAQDTKIVKKPSGGSCVCPICGNIHAPGKHVHSDDKKSIGTKITENGVVSTIGVIQGNIDLMLKDDKFKSRFNFNQQGVQKVVGKKMEDIGRGEQSIYNDLSKTEKNIAKMNSKKGGFLSGLITNPIGTFLKIAVFAVGSLILITLTRMAWRNWKNTYMPKSSGKGISLFGFTIPGLEEIKNFGLGIWNFIRVGLPNAWKRLSGWFGGIHKMLVGKNGMFSNGHETLNTFRKIGIAWLIGQTKKVGGTALNMLINILAPILNIALPGSGIALKIIAFICPLIYSFVLNQIQMIMGNSNADMKSKMDSMTKSFNSQNSSQNLQKRFDQIGVNVKSFAPPNAIPGLETPKQGSGLSRKPAAIMRRVNVHSQSTRKENKAIQEQAFNQDKEKVASKTTYNRVGSQKTQSVVGKLMFNEGYSMQGRYYQEHSDILMRTYKNAVIPQIKAIDSYIEELSKSKRFQNVNGPLYDINTGWNPGYAVTQEDLYTPIPLTPFGEIHPKADIRFGTPSGTNESWVGRMPFTWMQTPPTSISVNPISYEIERAKKIREIWIEFAQRARNMHLMYNDGAEKLAKIMPSYEKKWLALNYIEKGGYSDKTYYKDRFIKFLERFRNGQVSENSQNTLAGEEKMHQDDKYGTLKKIGRITLAASSLGLSEIYISELKMAKSIKNYASQQSENANRAMNYNANKEEYKSVKGKGFFGGLGAMISNVGTALKNGVKSADSAYWLNKFRGITANGIEYGKIRDLMFDQGILDMFKERRFLAPIDKASTLVRILSDGILSIDSPKSGVPWIFPLFEKFLSNQGISYKEPLNKKSTLWDRMKNDKHAQSGFSQSLLEYFGILMMPRWNRVERLLKHVISNNGDKTPMLIKAIHDLVGMFTEKSIFDFLGKHLRFRNIKTTFIDYSNANWFQRRIIDNYKKKLGIPDEKEKNKILNSKTKDIKESDKIMEQIKELQKKMNKVEFEVRYIGGGREFLNAMNDKMFSLKMAYLSARQREEKQGSSTIVNKSTSIATVVEPPPKTQEQIQKEQEEERKRLEEQRKREEAQKRKEEEEKKKKLEEEKKRREEVAIAEAKIKAMEAIRKQEQNYETILEKLVSTPDKVTDAELKSVGDDLKNLKQEAENRIGKLPREERELKLSLIRGDKVSEKTFSEIKETAIGLNGNLQAYVNEVNQIPIGSIVSIQNSSIPRTTPIQMQDSDNVDMGD